MRNLSFFKLPFRRNFMSLRKDSTLLPYSFLESYKMQSLLESLPNGSPIKRFMSNDFTQQQLFKERYLFKELVDKEIMIAANLKEQINSKQYNIQEIMDILVDRNIINFDIWMGIMKTSLTTRIREMEQKPEFGDIIVLFKRYIEKYVNRSLLHRFKFNLNDVNLKEIDFSNIMDTMYKKRGDMKTIKDQKNIFAFIKELNSKQALDMVEVKKYYKKQIPMLKDLIDKEEEISLIPAMHAIYTALGIDNPDVTKIFQNRLEKLYENAKVNNKNLDLYDILQIASTWVNTAEFNPNLKIHNIKEMSEFILSANKTIQFFYSLIMVNQENQELIDKILLGTDLQEININLKVMLHKCLHVLAIRGYDLSKHTKLIQKISSVCLSNYYLTIEILEKKKIEFKSPCICRTDSINNVTNYSVQLTNNRYIDDALRGINQLIVNSDIGNKIVFLRGLRFCRFSLQGVIIQNNEVYYLDFIENGDYLIKPIGEKKLKMELLKYYGFKICRIDPLCSDLHDILSKSDDLQVLLNYIKQRQQKQLPQAQQRNKIQ